MNLTDIVYMMDVKYNGDGAVVCPNEGKEVVQSGRKFTEHGKMTVHKSASHLVCGRCGYTHFLAK